MAESAGAYFVILPSRGREVNKNFSVLAALRPAFLGIRGKLSGAGRDLFTFPALTLQGGLVKYSLSCPGNPDFSLFGGKGADVVDDKKQSFMYKILRFLVYLFYRRPTIVGAERLPEEPCILVGNHTQMNGPIVGELFLPGKHYIWCAGQMMHWKEVAPYAFEDFWSFKPKWTHPFFRLLSWLITPIAVCLFNNAHTIPVYHDARLRATLRESMERLEEGNSLVIFPEHNVPYNHILYDFQDRFIDLARMYYRKTGKALSFVPMYVAPALHETHMGEPIRFDPAAPIDDERARIKQALMDAITALAEALPEHTVVPYRNIRKRDYPKNTPKKETA